MAASNFISVKVEPPSSAPGDYPIMRAQALRLDQNGALHVLEETGVRVFAAGTWESVMARCLAPHPQTLIDVPGRLPEG